MTQAKLQADPYNGVYRVDTFSEGIEILDDISFHSCIDYLVEGEIVGAIVGATVLGWIEEEYTLKPLPTPANKTERHIGVGRDRLGIVMNLYGTKELALSHAFNHHHPEHGVFYPYSLVYKGENGQLLYSLLFFEANHTKPDIWQRVIDNDVFDDESPCDDDDLDVTFI